MEVRSVEPEHWAEFDAVREAAYNGLRRGRYIEHARSLPACQYLVLPAFENAVSWDVMRGVERGAHTEIRLWRSCWRMDQDARAFSSPMERLKHPRPYRPTVDVGWTLLDSSRIESIIACLRSIRVPLGVTNSHMGCDGVSYELSVGESFCNARICWWCDLPDEWLELGPVVADLVQLFELSWASRAQVAPASRCGG
jgi:hypothetical protein